MVGSGSAFRVCLPLAAGNLNEEPPAHRHETAGLLATESVVIVSLQKKLVETITESANAVIKNNRVGWSPGHSSKLTN